VPNRLIVAREKPAPDASDAGYTINAKTRRVVYP
jgi:hypothetical protein